MLGFLVGGVYFVAHDRYMTSAHGIVAWHGKGCSLQLLRCPRCQINSRGYDQWPWSVGVSTNRQTEAQDEDLDRRSKYPNTRHLPRTRTIPEMLCTWIVQTFRAGVGATELWTATEPSHVPSTRVCRPKNMTSALKGSNLGILEEACTAKLRTAWDSVGTSRFFLFDASACGLKQAPAG